MCLISGPPTELSAHGICRHIKNHLAGVRVACISLFASDAGTWIAKGLSVRCLHPSPPDRDTRTCTGTSRAIGSSYAVRRQEIVAITSGNELRTSQLMHRAFDVQWRRQHTIGQWEAVPEGLWFALSRA